MSSKGYRASCEPGYVGIWRGWTAPPPRIGAAAPKRWAAEPAGPPPFAYRAVYEALARLITPWEYAQARLNYLAWRRERHGDFATGIFRLEMADARRRAGHRSVYRAPVANDDYGRKMTSGAAYSDDKNNGTARALGPWRQGVDPISHDEWRTRGYGMASIPAKLISSPKDRALLARVLAQSPGRDRGRPTVNDEPMTDAERQSDRRSRIELEILKRDVEVRETGKVPLTALGWRWMSHRQKVRLITSTGDRRDVGKRKRRPDVNYAAPAMDRGPRREKSKTG
jgi:hypothetical protein